MIEASEFSSYRRSKNLHLPQAKVLGTVRTYLMGLQISFLSQGTMVPEEKDSPGSLEPCDSI